VGTEGFEPSLEAV